MASYYTRLVEVAGLACARRCLDEALHGLCLLAHPLEHLGVCSFCDRPWRKGVHGSGCFHTYAQDVLEEIRHSLREEASRGMQS